MIFTGYFRGLLTVSAICFSYGNHAGIKYAKRTPILDKVKPSIVYEPDLPNCTVPMCTGPLSEIYCTGKLIHTSWLFGLQDSCPGDMMLNPPDRVIQAFKKLSYPLKREHFKRFCADNFAQTPYLQITTLADWTEEPQNVRLLKSITLRNFTSKLNQIWRTLGREFIPQVSQTPDRFPVLSVPNPFVVPGGLFQIYFYWDSYWIIKGLLFSNMTGTVRHMIENFAYVIQFHGFIPNSGSIQLTRRSQPPLFTQMIADYFEATNNETLLVQMIPYIDSELTWWLTNRTVTLTLKDGSTKFSIRTNKIVPLDLNVIMHMNYDAFAKILASVNRTEMASLYRERATKLRKAIETIMWNDEDGIWYDYDLELETHRRKFYPSNIFPLIFGDSDQKTAKRVLAYLNRKGVLEFPGGIPATLDTFSHEQWDFPNGWGPSIHLFVESLRRSGNTELLGVARQVANGFIRTVYNGLMNPLESRPPVCWEKYDVRFDDGTPGVGGEYPVQQGFGWTNGAVLDMIYQFHIRSPEKAEDRQKFCEFDAKTGLTKSSKKYYLKTVA